MFKRKKKDIVITEEIITGDMFITLKDTINNIEVEYKVVFDKVAKSSITHTREYILYNVGKDKVYDYYSSSISFSFNLLKYNEAIITINIIKSETITKIVKVV